MRILIVEDEGIIAQRLIRLLQGILGTKITSLRHLPELYSGLTYIKEHPIDVLFLDLNLNGEDGFRFLAEVVAGSFQTIIVSAHTDQAIRAFEYGVLDFIGKPYTEQRLRKALDRLSERGTESPSTKFLGVRIGAELRVLNVSDITFIRAADDYSEIHCGDGSAYLHDKSLSNLIRILPRCFQRVHRSYCVNLTAVKSYESHSGSRYSVVLASGEHLPVSRKRIASIRQQL